MLKTKTEPRIAYERAGERGPEVLLVMGLGMRGDLWRPQLERLKADHRIVSFDNRGIGESDALRGFATMRDFAQDALRVADEAGFGRFHLVGVSLGGMISQELAILAPSRLRSLTLIATHSGGWRGLVPHPKGLYHFARAFGSRGSGRIDALQQLLYTPSFLRSVDRSALSERIAQQTGVPAKPRSTVGQLLAVARHDTRERLREMLVPTLVIKPEDDVLVRPSHSDRLGRLIPNARVHSVKGAGHGLLFQCADDVTALIRAQIAEHEGTP